MSSARQLRQERDELMVRTQAIVDKAEEEKRGLTEEEHTEWKRLMLQIAEHDRMIEVKEAMEAKSEPPPVRSEVIAPQTSGEQIPQDELTGRERLIRWIMSSRAGDGIVIGNALEPQVRRDRVKGPARERQLARMERSQRAFFATQQPDEFEARALGIGTDTAGGYLVDDDISSFIEKAMKQYGGIFNTRAMVIPTMNGAPFDYPTLNDTANEGEQLNENTAAAAQDLGFANVVLGAYKFSSKTVVVSLEMLQDTAFDIETLIFDCFAERIGRIVGRRT